MQFAAVIKTLESCNQQNLHLLQKQIKKIIEQSLFIFQSRGNVLAKNTFV